MSAVKNNLTPFEQAFSHNLAVRPCGYEPAANFDTYVDDEQGLVKQILGLQYKMLWFHSYCASRQLEGRLEANDFNVMIFESAGTGMVTATAKVYIGENCVATGCASKGFTLNNVATMDAVIQNATGSALSRALSAAGFGCISSNEPDVPPAGFTDAGSNLSYIFGNTNPAPAPGNVPPANQPPMSPVSGATVNATAPAVQNPGAPTQASLFQDSPAPAMDPLMAAKAAMWPCSGYYGGKTLGEVLATAPQKIIWLAENYKQACPAKEAAKLLLPEAKRCCGM